MNEYTDSQIDLSYDKRREDAFCFLSIEKQEEILKIQKRRKQIESFVSFEFEGFPQHEKFSVFELIEEYSNNMIGEDSDMTIEYVIWSLSHRLSYFYKLKQENYIPVFLEHLSYSNKNFKETGEFLNIDAISILEKILRKRLIK